MLPSRAKHRSTIYACHCAPLHAPTVLGPTTKGLAVAGFGPWKQFGVEVRRRRSRSNNNPFYYTPSVVYIPAWSKEEEGELFVSFFSRLIF